jgi:hypothetical protein
MLYWGARIQKQHFKEELNGFNLERAKVEYSLQEKLLGGEII